MGLEGLVLTGWAETPRYDPARQVLYWARALRGDQGDETLNYEVRVLGRAGVLSLNAVADLGHLPAVRTAMEPIRASASFTQGQTYADYEPGVDPTAGLGIAALIGGGAMVAGKAGLFKGLLAALLAGKKFIIIGLVAAGGVLARLFGRSKSGGSIPN